MGMDHYVKVKEFGGVSGAILAQDKQNSQRWVVIKRVSDGAQGMEELSASLRVRHPNIVQFVESFVNDGSLYVVVKYEPGGDLDSLLSRLKRLKKVPTTLTQLTWFVQMLDALAYCHENNIIHRDVKPSNIFLSEDTKTLYLGDFGSSKTLGTGNVTTTFVGSPMWISPEVLLGTPYSYSSDVWSMGCVFYEMASLHRPFAAPSFARLVQQITSGRVAPMPEMVEEPVRSIVASMLVIDPAMRPSAAELLATAQRALHNERRRLESAAKQQQRQPQEQHEPRSSPYVLAAPPPVQPQPQQNPHRAPSTAAAAALPAVIDTTDSGEDGAVYVDPDKYLRSRQGSGDRQQQQTPPAAKGDLRSSSPSATTQPADQLAGSMYASAGGGGSGSSVHPQPSTTEPTTPPPPPPLVITAISASPAAAPSAPPDEDETAASAQSFDDSLTLSDGEAAAAAAAGDGGDDGGAGGRAVSMFVAITPRRPRKTKKAAGPAKKKRPPSAQQQQQQQQQQQRVKKSAPSTPPPAKALSRNPSLTPSNAKSPPVPCVATPPATPPLAKAAEVRTFSPKQLDIHGRPCASAPSPATAVAAAPSSTSPSAVRPKRGVVSAMPPPALQGFQRTVTAPSAAAGDVSPSSVGVAASGRVRSNTLTDNRSDNNDGANCAPPNRRGSGHVDDSHSNRGGAAGGQLSRQQQGVATKPPPPPQVPKRALAAALERRGSPQAAQPSPPPITKKRPQKAAAQPLVGASGETARPDTLRERLAAAAAADGKSSDTSSSDGAGGGVTSMRKSQWIRAKRDDVSDIENYLLQFRGHDEELLLSYDVHNASAGSRRRPSLVGQTGAAARSERSPARRGHRGASPEAAPPPPPAPPQQLQRGVRKSGSGGADRERRVPAGTGARSAASPERGRQASNAHASQPRTPQEQQQVEDERRAAREKREAARQQMAQMIQQQRRQRQKQGKQKRKETDPFDVEVILPGKA